MDTWRTLVEARWLNHQPLFTSEDQQILVGWICEQFYPYSWWSDRLRGLAPLRRNSLELGKLLFARYKKVKTLPYLPTVGQFEHTMHICGFEPLETASDSPFESYYLSPRSPMLQPSPKRKWK